MAKTDKHLGELEQILLLSLVKLGDNAYGGSIRQHLQENIDREIGVGGIYTVLDRMQQKGYVTSELGQPTEKRSGRPKRFFFITEQGKILPRRATGVTVQQQRKLSKAIKRARVLSLFPFVASDPI